MSIEINIKADPPAALIRIIEKEYSPIKTIKSVLIDINVPELKANEDTGAFDPDKGEIIIDLNNCLRGKKWVSLGMMIIPSIWFNMLYTAFHEAAHAKQLEENPELIKLDTLPEIKEHAADLEALDKLYEWSEKNTIPKIDEMGWAGERIKDLVNAFYSDTGVRLFLFEEMEVVDCNGVAEVDNFTTHRKDSFNQSSYKALCDAIDKEEFGIKLKGKRYLHADEFFAAD